MLGLYLLAALTPFHDLLIRLWPALKPWDDLVVVGLAVSLIPWIRSAPARALPPFWPPLAAFAAVSLLSALWNPILLSQAFGGMRQMLPYAVAGLAVARYCRRADVLPLLRVMASAAAVCAVYGLVSYCSMRRLGVPWFNPPWPEDPWSLLVLYPYYCGGYPVPPGWRLVSTFLNDNYFALWMVMMAPLVWVLSLEEPDRLRRWKQVGTAALMIVAMTWCYSRAALLAFGASTAFLALRLGPRALWLLLPAAAAAPLFLTWIEAYRFDPGMLPATIGGRVDSLAVAREALFRQPLLGLGPGTRGVADLNPAKIAYETGLLGLAAWGWAVWAAVRPGWRFAGGHAGDGGLAAALAAALVATAVASVGGEVWEIPQLGYSFWMLAGLLHVLARNPDPAEEGGPGGLRSACGGGGTMAPPREPIPRPAASLPRPSEAQIPCPPSGS